jgi:tetratricopeptide (TPR) repeat protein/predicted Ser/Thr protein kinase
MEGTTMVELPSAAATVTLTDTIDHAHVAVIARGTTIGRYVVVGHLGAGGMGSVYAAFDAQLERRVAIKVLRPDARGGDGHARLLREAQAMARLSHPNVVAVHDVGTYGDDVFLAMDYVEGRTLKAWMQESHTWREGLAVLKAAGKGLAAAHAAGLIHRDFKPENVLIGDDGRVAVADFGIARAHGAYEPPDERTEPTARLRPVAANDVTATLRTEPTAPVSSRTGPSSLETPLTETGALMGTAGYMAPERAFESRDDARSDQFSFAVTAYRVLYGRPPFTYSDVSTYMTALLSDPLAPPVGTRVPAWVQAVITRGLAREPEDRFASMDDLLAALDRDPTRRRVGWALGVAGALVASLALLGWADERRVIRAKCAAGDALIAEAWNPRVQGAVGAAIRGSGTPLADDIAVRTGRVLGDWSKAWASAYRDASEATLLRGVESTTTMNVRLACLDRQRDALAALADRLAHADKGVAHRALPAAYALPPPKGCWEPNAARAAALPAAPGARARVLALQKELAQVSATTITGSCDGVIAAANRGIAEARAIPHRPSEASFLMVRAGCEWDSGDVTASIASEQAAFVAALAAGDDSLAAVAAAKIAFDYADKVAKVHEGEGWLAIGKGILEREGADDRAEAELLNSEVEILSYEGYGERAIPLHERDIELLTRVYGPAHPSVAAAYNNYGTDLNDVGRQEDGIAALRKGIAINEAIYGPNDPMLHIDYNNIGVAYTQLGRYDDAREALAHAIVLAKPLGAKSANGIVLWASMAVVDNRAGRPDAAMDDVEQAMAIVRETGDNGARFLPCLYEQRGRALLARHDAAGAVVACAQGVKLQEEQEVIGPDKIYSDDAITCLGEAELAAGKIDDAIAHLERSVTLTKRDWKGGLPIAKIDLARALRAGKRDEERGRRLAEEGVAGLKGVAGAEAQEKEGEAWVAAEGKR